MTTVLSKKRSAALNAELEAIIRGNPDLSYQEIMDKVSPALTKHLTCLPNDRILKAKKAAGVKIMTPREAGKLFSKRVSTKQDGETGKKVNTQRINLADLPPPQSTPKSIEGLAKALKDAMTDHGYVSAVISLKGRSYLRKEAEEELRC